MSCILQAVYWFNPCIWYAFRVMRRDREIACDCSVIRTVGKEHAAGYGHTLIRYAEKLSKNAFFAPLSPLGGGKAAIVQRIREIPDYRPLTPGRRFCGICIMLTAFVLVCSASPLLTVYASRGSSSVLADADVQAVDLASYFRGNEGSFVLYDITEDRFLVYNEELGERRAAPACQTASM